MVGGGGGGHLPVGGLVILAFFEDQQCPRPVEGQSGGGHAGSLGGEEPWTKGLSQNLELEVGGHGWVVITVALTLLVCPQAHQWP